jgi:hypothetical protein
MFSAADSYGTATSCAKSLEVEQRPYPQRFTPKEGQTSSNYTVVATSPNVLWLILYVKKRICIHSTRVAHHFLTAADTEQRATHLSDHGNPYPHVD